MEQEFEFALETRYRVNKITDGKRPVDPDWGEWSPWRVARTYPTLAGAAMAKSHAREGVQHDFFSDKEPTMEYQARVAYRLVPKTWTPILPDLGQ